MGRKTMGMVAVTVLALLAVVIPMAGTAAAQELKVPKSDPDFPNSAALLPQSASIVAADQVILNPGGGTAVDGSDGVEVFVGDDLQHQFRFVDTGWVYPDTNTPTAGGVDFDIVLEVDGVSYSTVLQELVPVPASLFANSDDSAAVAQVYLDLDDDDVYNAANDYRVAVRTETDGSTPLVEFDFEVTAPATGAGATHSLRLWVDTDRADLTGAPADSGDKGYAYGIAEDGVTRMLPGAAASTDVSEIGVVRAEGAAEEMAMSFVETTDEIGAWSTGSFAATRAQARSTAGPAGNFTTSLHDNGVAISFPLTLSNGQTAQVSTGLQFEAPQSGPQEAVVLAEPCVAFDSKAAGAAVFTIGETRTAALTGDLSSSGGAAAGCLPPDCALSATFSIQAIDPAAAGNLRVSAQGVAALGGVVNFAANDLDNANTIISDVSPGAHAVDIFANGATIGATSTHVKLIVLGYWVPAGSSCGGVTPLEFYPLEPCAILDTRAGIAPPPAAPYLGPIVMDTVLDVDVVDPIAVDQQSGRTQASCGIPTTADVAVVNVVAIGAPGKGGVKVAAGGALGVAPAEILVPFKDTNPTSLTNAAVAYAPIDGFGQIAVEPTGPAGEKVQMRVVVLGYLDDPSATGLSWNPLAAPCAAFDTRNGSGTFAGKRDASAAAPPTTTYQIEGTFPAAQGGSSGTGGAITTCAVPATAEAIAVNLVAIDAAGPGNIRAASSAVFNGGVVNFDALKPAMSNSNGTIIPLGAAGEIVVQPNCGCEFPDLVHVRGVVFGYFSN